MVGFLGDEEVREVWRARDGHQPVLSRAAAARVDPGGGQGQRLPSAPDPALRPLWGTSLYMQNPQHYREMQRRLRENEPQGTAISHAELLRVPKSRLHYLMRPGLAEEVKAKNQRHAAWRDDPMRHLCREQAYRCQLRAVDPHSGSVHRGACLPVACGGIATVSLSHNALVAGLCTGALLVWRLRRVGYAFSAPSVEARPISVLAAGAPTAVRCVAVGREEDVVVAAYDDSVWVRG